MSARALLERALAAVAVTGLAVAGPALSAGAATEPPPLVSLTPSGVTVVAGTRPVVTVGAPSAPAPGVHATVPVSGDAHASVGRPDAPAAPLTPPIATPSLGAAAPLLGPTATAARLVDADVSLRLCLAAALLGGRDDGCGSPAPSGPSLVDAVARTFLCARVAVLGADGAASCDVGHPSGSDGADPPALLGTDAQSGACLTAIVVGAADHSRCGTDASAPAGPSPTAPGGIDGATAALESSTCAVIAVLGGATGCPGTAPEPTGPATGSGGNGGTVVSTVDACVALAALSSDAAPACPTTSAAGTPGGAPGTPVLVTAATATPGSTVFGAELAATTGGSGSADPHGDLAFSGADTVFLTLTGLGAIAGGAALRRAGRLGTVR